MRLIRELLELALDDIAPAIPYHPAVTRAISLLDQIDGDPDLEPEPIEVSGEEDERYPTWIN